MNSLGTIQSGQARDFLKRKALLESQLHKQPFVPGKSSYALLNFCSKFLLQKNRFLVRPWIDHVNRGFFPILTGCQDRRVGSRLIAHAQNPMLTRAEETLNSAFNIIQLAQAQTWRGGSNLFQSLLL